jgi:hypothetical protein
MVDLGSPKALVLITFAAAILLFVVALLLVSPRGVDLAEESENITGSPPLLGEGDNLIYSVNVDGKEFNVSVKAAGRDAVNNCSLLKQESAYHANITGCYSEQNGSLVYAVVGGSIVSRDVFAGGLPAIHAFEPWMAAAKVGWSGSARVSRSLKPGFIPMLSVGETIETHYWCNETENVFGRAALKVESVTFRRSGRQDGARSLIGSRTIWVDVERRVMLKEEAHAGDETATYSILSAPFLLNASG